jgi:hypothetical protein
VRCAALELTAALVRKSRVFRARVAAEVDTLLECTLGIRGHEVRREYPASTLRVAYEYPVSTLWEYSWVTMGVTGGHARHLRANA